MSGHSITCLKREHQRGERKRSEQESEQFLLFFFEVFKHGGIFFQDAKIKKSYKIVHFRSGETIQEQKRVRQSVAFSKINRKKYTPTEKRASGDIINKYSLLFKITACA
jgi:hypothetical protein